MVKVDKTPEIPRGSELFGVPRTEVIRGGSQSQTPLYGYPFFLCGNLIITGSLLCSWRMKAITFSLGHSLWPPSVSVLTPYQVLDRRSFIDPICCNSCMVLSMLLGWFWPIFLFSLRDINLTLGLLPPRRHAIWRDSVGVESSGSGLKIRVRGYFASEFSLVVAPY